MTLNKTQKMILAQVRNSKVSVSGKRERQQAAKLAQAGVLKLIGGNYLTGVTYQLIK